jgi:hypothetical protein
MRIFRPVMIALVAVLGLAAATPALAQNTNVTPANRLWPSFAPELTTKAQSTPNQQGLGIFVQGGWIQFTTYGNNGVPDNISTKLNGFIVGVSFGGNKSGVAGVGVDINYMAAKDNDTGLFDEGGDLSLSYIDIPVYARFNFFGHHTKNAATLYAIGGGFVDILLKGEIGSTDVKDQFNGFDAGIVGGVGFEVARIGVEFRGNWALTTLASTGNNTFLNGFEDSKKLTLMLLFRVRLN